MARHLTPLELIHQLDLGDIVRLPDGRELTIRACERRLSVPVGDMAGWLLAGEIGPAAALLSLPPGAERSSSAPVTVFTPLEDVPPHARSARAVVEGVVSYWAPHLPGLSGAMGELAYRVCSLRTSTEPMVLVWRGRELVVFVKSAVTTPEALRCAFLDRSPDLTEADVVRYGALVAQPGQVRRPGAPAQQPGRAPTAPRIPLLPGRRR